MKELLTFLIKNITNSDDFNIEEESDGEKISLNVYANPSIIGLIIGKNGKTIKNLRRIVAIRGAQEKKVISINVIDQENPKEQTDLT